MTLGSSHHDHKNSKSNQHQAHAQSPPSFEDSELGKLNRRLKHITDTILPSVPYLLKLHSDRPFHTSQQQEADLLRYTPFHAGEELLQYTSFSASNWEDSLFTPVGGWEDDQPDDISSSSRSQKMQSASVTPKAVAKKISIGEYRKRAAAQSGVNGTTKSSETTKQDETKVEERASPGKHDSSKPAQGARDLKRPAEDRQGEVEESQKVDSTPPTKKPRMSLNPSRQQVEETALSAKFSLPGPISPTLPPVFEKTLAEIDCLAANDQKHHKPTASEKSSADESKNESSRAESTTKLSKEKNAARNTLSKKQDLDDSNSRSTEAVVKALPNGTSPSASRKEGKIKTESLSTNAGPPVSKASSKDTEGLQSEARRRPSKIVTLKFSRSMRKGIARLLNLPPKSKNASSTSRTSVSSLDKEPQPVHSRKEELNVPRIKEEKGSQHERVRSNTIGSNSKSGEKRHGQESDPDALQPQSKRQKLPESRTPQAFKSPVLSSHGSLKKPRDSTPSAPAKEEAVSTPSGSIRNGTPAAPSSVERTNREARHTPSASSGSYSQVAETHDALKHEQQKYFELGKSLKKESDRIYKAGQDPPPSPSMMKRYLIIRLEVALAFMLAYAVGDEICRLDRVPFKFEKTWQTLFPWLRQLQQQTIDHQFLRGLSLQLEAVAYMVVWNIESEHAASTGFDKPDHAKALKRRHDEAQRLFVEGSSLLSVDDLQEDFPKTWRSKSRAPLAHPSPPKLTSTTLGGDFYLPITSITVPIEAVRAGRSLLGEWCKREGVEWTPKLNF